MIYGKIFYGKKKEFFFFFVKCFTDLKSVRHFTEKWFDFPLTRKIFSVDHLFSVKQTPENPKTFSYKSFSVKQTDPIYIHVLLKEY